MKGLPEGSTSSATRGLMAPSSAGAQQRQAMAAQQSQYLQAVSAQQAEQAAWEASHVKLDTGEWVTKDFYDSLSNEQRVYIQAAGVDKFNSRNAQLKAASESLPKTSDGQIDIQTAVGQGKDSDLELLGVTRTEIARTRSFLQNNVNIGGAWIPKVDWETLPAEDQSRMKEVGYDKWKTELDARNAQIEATNATIQAVENKMSGYKEGEGYQYIQALADKAVDIDELEAAGFVKANEREQALKDAANARDAAAAIAKIDQEKYRTMVDNEPGFDLAKIQYDEVLSPHELMLVFGGTQEGRDALRSAQKLISARQVRDIRKEYGTPSYKRAAKAAGIAKTYLDWTVPGYGTQRHWSNMAGWQKGLSIGGDFLILIPVVKAVGAVPGAIVRGATVTSQVGKVGVATAKSAAWGVYAAESVVGAGSKVIGRVGMEATIRLGPKEVRMAGVAARNAGKLGDEASLHTAQLFREIDKGGLTAKSARLSSRAQTTIAKAAAADRAFIDKMGNITQASSRQLKALEKLSGYKGMAGKIIEIGKYQRQLDKTWSEIEMLEQRAKQLNQMTRADQAKRYAGYVKELTKAQATRAKLGRAMDEYTNLMKVRGVKQYKLIAIPSKGTIKELKAALRKLPKSERGVRIGKAVKVPEEASRAAKFVGEHGEPVVADRTFGRYITRGGKTEFIHFGGGGGTRPSGLRVTGQQGYTGTYSASVKAPDKGLQKLLDHLGEKYPIIADDIRRANQGGQRLAGKMGELQPEISPGLQKKVQLAVQEQLFKAPSTVEMKPGVGPAKPPPSTVTEQARPPAKTKKVTYESEDVRRGMGVPRVSGGTIIDAGIVWAVGKPIAKVSVVSSVKGAEWVSPSRLEKLMTQYQAQFNELSQIRSSAYAITDVKLRNMLNNWLQNQLSNAVSNQILVAAAIQTQPQTQTETQTQTQTKTKTAVETATEEKSRTETRTRTDTRGSATLRGMQGNFRPWRPIIPWLPEYEGNKDEAKKLIKGSVCFKMGELNGKGVWWILYPPDYGINAGPGVGPGKAVWVHTQPPKNVRVESGPKSAYKTIQRLGGPVPATITGSIGFADYSIASGQNIVFEQTLPPSIAKGSVSWRQGELGWWTLYPPTYGVHAGAGAGEGKMFTTTKPEGTTEIDGPGSAAKTIRALGGKVPENIIGKVGFAAYHISKGKDIKFKKRQPQPRLSR